MREVIKQLDELLATPPEQSPFGAPTERDTDPQFRAAYQAVVRDEINPAVRRYREFLSQTYLPAAREALGVSANPNGRACYDAVVRQFSTVSMPADQVYETGWQQIRALDEQMRPLAVRLTGTDDLARAMHMVNTEPRFAFKTEADVVAYAQAAQDRASAAMPRAFGLLHDAAGADPAVPGIPRTRRRAGAIPVAARRRQPAADSPAEHLGPDAQESRQHREHDVSRNLARASPASHGGA